MEGHKKKKNIKLWIGIAVLIVILVGIGVYLFNLSETQRGYAREQQNQLLAQQARQAEIERQQAELERQMVQQQIRDSCRSRCESRGWKYISTDVYKEVSNC